MAYISINGCKTLLQGVFMPDVAVLPDTVFIALTTNIPDKGVSGSDLREPDFPSYSRIEYGIGSDFWSINQQTLINTQDLVWPVPSDSWGRILGWALCTEETLGDVLACGDLSPETSIAAGADISIYAGSLRLKLV